MKLKSLIIMVLAVILSTSSLLRADEPKPEINLKGKIFMDWTSSMESKKDGEAQDDAYQKFSVSRVYLTWKKNLNDIFSIRVTSDILATESTDDASYDESAVAQEEHTHNPDHSKYDIYVKYAYLQTKHKFGDIQLKSMIGLTKTASIGFIDDVLTGTRYINKNFLDSSKSLIMNKSRKGVSLDNSADLGINLTLKYTKLIELSTCYVNGEGYKEVSVEKDDQGKQFGARLSVTPIEGLYVNGYFNNNDKSTQNSTGDNYVRYMGGGVAWVTDMLKVGFNYFSAKEYKNDEDQGDMWLLDSWLRFNLQPVAQVPVFFYARYGLGKNKDVDNSKKTYIGAGAGYTFHKNVEMIAYYNQTETDTEEETKDKQFQLKAQIKF